MSSQAYGFYFGVSVLGYMVGSFANRRLLRGMVQSETRAALRLRVLIVGGAGDAALCR